MGWFDWLRQDPAPVVDLPVFGRVRAAHRPSSGPWLWETLNFVQARSGPVDVGFDAGAAGPGSDHEQQWNYILDHLDELTRLASPMIGPELSEFLEKPFPSDPWAELEWQGAHLTGDIAGGRFEISYSSKSWPDALITVYFEQGSPTLIQIDD